MTHLLPGKFPMGLGIPPLGCKNDSSSMDDRKPLDALGVPCKTAEQGVSDLAASALVSGSKARYTSSLFLRGVPELSASGSAACQATLETSCTPADTHHIAKDS